MLNVECSIEHRKLSIEHSSKTRDTLYGKRAFEQCGDEPSWIMRARRFSHLHFPLLPRYPLATLLRQED
jgi:hypothetical protein